LLKTPLCEVLGIDFPIIQGGMAYLGSAELVSAVSEAGGLGIIGSGSSQPSWIQDQITLVRALTNKPFGLNIMLMSPYVEDVVQLAIEEKVPIITTGGGNPGIYLARLKESGAKILPVVSIKALAKRLDRQGVDAIIAEGMESGGHVGETTTMALVPQIVDAVSVPVIAAGGMADGRGLAAALTLGAQAVQMGTRFICAEECIAHTNFKQKILAVGDHDTVVTGESLGHPARCLKNKLTRQFQSMEQSGVPAEELDRFGIGKLYAGIIDGDIEQGSLMAGQIAGLVSDIKPARSIIHDIVLEAEAVFARINSAMGTNGENPSV